MHVEAVETVKAINSTLEATQERTFRKHLGASVIGKKCSRRLWYSFRWALRPWFEGRMVRLFDRGHREEERIFSWLKGAGCEIWTRNEDGKQFRISDHNGHFGGSLDGVALGVPDVPKGEPCVVEAKTHAEKYFTPLVKKGVLIANREHYVQTNIYMGKYGIEYGLYFAINKNTDAIHLEILRYDQKVAEHYIERAGDIINAPEAPPRMSSDPSWWECRFCPYKGVCHQDEVAEINCRTCAFSTPVEKKKWACERFEKPVIMRSDNLVLYTGCPWHIYLPDMIGGATLLEVSSNKDWLLLNVDGEEIKHGRYYTNSLELRRMGYGGY